MPRTARASQGNWCYHVLNRGNGRAEVFHKPDDFAAFFELFGPACQRLPMRILGWCLMPNHFHLVLRPHDDGELSRWMQWLMPAEYRSTMNKKIRNPQRLCTSYPKSLTGWDVSGRYQTGVSRSVGISVNSVSKEIAANRKITPHSCNPSSVNTDCVQAAIVFTLFCVCAGDVPAVT